MQRPLYHFTPPRNFMNDPNGLVFYEGEYHLFYQHNPEGETWGHMSWGHAVSRDLVSWEHLPVALREEGGVMVFSGSAVVDGQNTSGLGSGGDPPLVAFYTGHGASEQTQNVAFSTDRGRTWTRHSANPVLSIGSRDFRDPKVFWHAPTQRWVMVTVLAVLREVRFDVSSDLVHWEYAGGFGPAGPDEGAWECPDLFELPGPDGVRRWVLKVDVQKGPGALYFVGDFDGSRFVTDPGCEQPRRVDHGRDFYAAQSFSDLPGDRRVWLAWMSHWSYANSVPTSPWRGQLSIPRELRLAASPSGLQLAQRPAPELARLRRPLVLDANLDLAAANRALADSGGGASLEIGLTLAPGHASEVALRVREGARQATRVGFDARSEDVFIDRTGSGDASFAASFPGVHRAPTGPIDGRLDVRVFVDTCSVEVFAGGGRAVLSDLVFPDAASAGVSLEADAPVRVERLEVFRLGP